MSDTRKKQAEKLAAKVTEARAVLAAFDVKTITEILRRGERAAIPDGMNPVSLEGGGGSGSGSTTVESAAIRGLSEDDAAEWVENDAGELVRAEVWTRHEPPDPIGDYIVEIVQRLDEVIDATKILDKRRQVVIHAADGRRGRQPSVGHCQACHRVVPGSEVDRLRSGYCDYAADFEWSGCYRKYVDQNRPDRLAFERWVASQMAIMAEEAARVAAVARHNGGASPKALPLTALPNSKKEPLKEPA